MKKHRRKLLVCFFIILGIWSVTLGPLYAIAISTRLPGSRGGPQDAFRHTFSCALVAKTISPKVVELVTWVLERDDHSALDLMDRHNNRIGTQIGLANHHLNTLYDEVLTAVSKAQVNSQDPNVITLLPEDKWEIGF